MQVWRYLLVMVAIASGGRTFALDARTIVKDAMDNWRGQSSYSEITMTIHRSDWERSMSMKAWTQGDKKSLVRVTAPIKDAGNATLIDDDNMWSYSPKINRVIKIPSSMMSQGWMGSDFSNKDISRSTEILDQYEHTLSGQQSVDNHTVYEITSIPHEDAPVVWGKEVLKIRDDYVVLEQQYWDQDGKLVKKMVSSDIQIMDGRPVAKIVRMSKVDTPEEWTQISNDKVQFNVSIPDSTFTQSNLRNARQ